MPITSFRSSPWIIKLENVKLIFEPLKLDSYTISEQKFNALQNKLTSLNLLEAHWFTTKKEEKSGVQTSDNNWMAYKSTILTNILENIQLEVYNLDIKYEDCDAFQKIPIICGVQLKCLKAESCNSNWVPGLASDRSSDTSHIFKVIEITQFSFYFENEQQHTSDHQYILHPLTAKLKLKKNQTLDPLNLGDGPRLMCDFTCEELIVKIDKVCCLGRFLW